MTTAIAAKLLTTEEAAEILRLQKQTLAWWRTENRGPAFVKVGFAIRYRESDLHEWLDRQTVRPESD